MVAQRGPNNVIRGPAGGSRERSEEDKVYFVDLLRNILSSIHKSEEKDFERVQSDEVWSIFGIVSDITS